MNCAHFFTLSTWLARVRAGVSAFVWLAVAIGPAWSQDATMTVTLLGTSGPDPNP